MTNACIDIFTRPQPPSTGRVSNARDHDTQYECFIEQNPAPAIVCGLHDLRYVTVNRSFLALTNSADDHWLRRSIYERDILKGVANSDLLKRALVEAQTIPQTLADLAMPNGVSRRVIVAGQPVTVAGQPCMLFTFTDIEAWRESEPYHARYRTSVEAAFANSSACMMIVDAANNVVNLANESLCSLTGYQADELAGRSIYDVDLWPLGIASGTIHTKCGQPLECLVSQASITVGEQTYVLWTFQDVTKRRMDERDLAAAIETTITESKWLSHAILDNLTLRSEPSRSSASSGLNDLTVREREVLALICEGMDDKTMARTLNVSGNTIRNHVARIYSKIGVNRRIAAAAWGRARGFDRGPKHIVLPSCSADIL